MTDWDEKIYAPKPFRHLGTKINFSTNTFFCQVGTQLFRPNLLRPPRGELYRPQIISPRWEKNELLGLKRHLINVQVNKPKTSLCQVGTKDFRP